MLYQHFRLYDGKTGEVLPTGGATVAWSHTTRIGAVSICSPQDHFSRAEGRDHALGRMWGEQGILRHQDFKFVLPTLRIGHPCRGLLVQAIAWLTWQALQ